LSSCTRICSWRGPTPFRVKIFKNGRSARMGASSGETDIYVYHLGRSGRRFAPRKRFFCPRTICARGRRYMRSKAGFAFERKIIVLLAGKQRSLSGCPHFMRRLLNRGCHHVRTEYQQDGRWPRSSPEGAWRIRRIQGTPHSCDSTGFEVPKVRVGRPAAAGGQGNDFAWMLPPRYKPAIRRNKGATPPGG